MGEVYLARQAGFEGFEKLLVIKVLLPHLVEDEEFIQMFLDEARIAARLNHPNVAQIFDLGEVDGAYYIAMEFIHGDDIIRIWKQARTMEKTVPLGLTARIIADAAAGLDYAHKAVDSNNQPLGLVHRDVSPQNILITFEGGVKVIDFGIAKAAGRASHTATGILKGKYAYMSPEQAAGKPIDHRSDVFALGVVLYEMATSLRLFKRDSEVSTLRAVADCEVPPPVEHNPRIDAGLQAIIMKALSRDVETRYQDGQQLRLALEDWISESRQPASSAHLAAFMQELYAKRLGEERARGKPFDESADMSPVGGPRRSGTNPTIGGRPRPSSQSNPSFSMPGQQGGTDPAVEQLPRSKAPLIGGIAAVALLGLGGVVFWPRPAKDPVTVQKPTLSIFTRPGNATVTINGKDVGVTPLENFDLTAGQSAQVRITLDGYKPVLKSAPGSGQQQIDVTLEKDVAAPVPTPTTGNADPRVDAARAEVQLTFDSQPAGATVLIGEEVVGKTPLTTRRPKSEQTVSVNFKLAGYRPFTKVVAFGGDQEVKAVLVKAVKVQTHSDPLDIKTGR